MGSIIVKKNIIEPGYIYYGRPIKRSKINKIGLKKNKIDNKTLAKEKKRFITIKNNRF